MDSAHPGQIQPRTHALLAGTLVAQPLVVIIAQLLHPHVTLDAAGYLGGAAEAPTRWFIAHVLTAVGAMLLVPAAFALLSLVRQRGRRLGEAGVMAGMATAALLGPAFVAEGSALRLAVTSELSRPEALRFADRYLESPEATAVLIGLVAFIVAILLLAIALIRSRSAPRWQPTLMIVGAVGAAAAPPGDPVGIVANVLLAVAFSALAIQTIRQPVRSAAPMSA